MAKFLKLLGFTDTASAEAVAAAMGAIAGPAVVVVRAGQVAALGQRDDAGPGRSWRGVAAPGKTAMLKTLSIVQRRLEAACQAAAFVPADPAQCHCPEPELGPLMADSHVALSAALAGPGRCHQWDVVLRWRPEDVVAARRQDIAESSAAGGQAALAAAVAAALASDHARRTAALRAALQSVALGVVAAGSGPAETAMTVLLPARGEAVLDTALEGLPDSVTEGASADLRGPLPPLSFAAVRVATAAPGDVARAWRALSLPDWIDAAGLRRQWHAAASRLHPDHGVVDHAPVAEAGSAFRLLRSLLPPAPPDQPWTLAALQRRGARRLLVPALEKRP